MPLRSSPVSPHQPTPGWLQHWSRSRVPALLGPRPAPPSPHSSGQTRPSYKSRLRARGPGHLEQLCRGDCTVRPARPAPTGARRHQQSQHCDLGPYVGYGCVLGLSPQVGKQNAGWCSLGLGHRWPGKGGTRARCICGGVTRGFQQFRANLAACDCRDRRRVALREWNSLPEVGAQVGLS